MATRSGAKIDEFLIKETPAFTLRASIVSGIFDS